MVASSLNPRGSLLERYFYCALNYFPAKFIWINTRTLSDWPADLLFPFTGTKKRKSGNLSEVLIFRMLKQLCCKKWETCFASRVWIDQCQFSCADDMVLSSQIPWGLKHLLEELAFLSVELLVLICIWHGFVLSNSFGSEASVKGFSFLSEGMWLKFRTIK